jgi:hypothetical protein
MVTQVFLVGKAHEDIIRLVLERGQDAREARGLGNLFSQASRLEAEAYQLHLASKGFKGLVRGDRGDFLAVVHDSPKGTLDAILRGSLVHQVNPRNNDPTLRDMGVHFALRANHIGGLPGVVIDPGTTVIQLKK